MAGERVFLAAKGRIKCGDNPRMTEDRIIAPGATREDDAVEASIHNATTGRAS